MVESCGSIFGAHGVGLGHQKVGSDNALLLLQTLTLEDFLLTYPDLNETQAKPQVKSHEEYHRQNRFSAGISPHHESVFVRPRGQKLLHHRGMTLPHSQMQRPPSILRRMRALRQATPLAAQVRAPPPATATV